MANISEEFYSFVDDMRKSSEPMMGMYIFFGMEDISFNRHNFFNLLLENHVGRAKLSSIKIWGIIISMFRILRNRLIPNPCHCVGATATKCSFAVSCF